MNDNAIATKEAVFDPQPLVRPPLWVVEWGAISLPLGHPSRITEVSVALSQEAAAAELATAESDFCAQMFEVVPRDTNTLSVSALEEAIAHCLNQARCIERRVVGNGELAARLIRLLREKGVIAGPCHG